jgi:phosphomannomutase
MKKVLAFDLDDTLAVTKSPISDRMAALLGRLLEYYDVCVITGGTFKQIRLQVIDRLSVSPQQLVRFHAMPTCGTRYYRYDTLRNEWESQYAEDLSEKERAHIINVLEKTAKNMGIWCDKPAGKIIEDRISQITMSALGQQATPEDKYAWAEKFKDVRPVYRDKVAEQLPGLEVRIGGTTSTDITRPGIDKAYGIGKLIDALDISKDEVLFFGDKLNEGGNDYPVKAMGIDSIAVDGWETTAYALDGVLGVTE